METFSSKKFHFDVETKTFSQEISVLSEGSTRNVFHRVYPDSCDLGFVMVSAKTGDEVEYVVNSVDDAGEGEIAGWNLIPTAASIRKVPACKGTKVLVIND